MLGRQQMTIWRMRIACRILQATYTPSEYVILIALPLKHSLQKRASVVGCTYSACLLVPVNDLSHILLLF